MSCGRLSFKNIEDLHSAITNSETGIKKGFMKATKLFKEWDAKVAFVDDCLENAFTGLVKSEAKLDFSLDFGKESKNKWESSYYQ